MATLRLLTDPADVHAALEAGLDWCDDVSMCTPAAASNLGKWSLWEALERNASKVIAAYVALDGLRSEPAALDWFQARDCLRFVPAADGSFRANAFRFRRAQEARVLMGAGSLTAAGLMAPLDAMLLWEGDAVDPFATAVDSLLARAGKLAHVPTQGELEAYATAFYAGAQLWAEIVELGAPFIRTTAIDVDVPELELLVDEKGIRAAMKTAREQLAGVATEKRRQDIRFHGGGGTYTVHWCPSLKLWAMFEKLENRYWNAFGTSRPDRESAVAITVEVNPPLGGIDRKMGGAFAADPRTGDIFLVHRGRIGGGQKGIGAELFWSRFRGGVYMSEPESEEKARVVLVGKVGAPSFARDVAGFVHEVGRIKAAASSGDQRRGSASRSRRVVPRGGVKVGPRRGPPGLEVEVPVARSKLRQEPKSAPLITLASLKEALLDVLRDGRDHDDTEILSTLALRFGVTEAQRRLTHASGRTRFGNSVDFAKGKLRVEELIHPPRPKVWRLKRSADPRYATPGKHRPKRKVR